MWNYLATVKANFLLGIGIHVHYQRLTNVEWKLVEERLQLRLSWKGKLLSNMVLLYLSIFQAGPGRA